jgi:hypothetical protein
MYKKIALRYAKRGILMPSADISIRMYNKYGQNQNYGFFADKLHTAFHKLREARGISEDDDLLWGPPLPPTGRRQNARFKA